MIIMSQPTVWRAKGLSPFLVIAAVCLASAITKARVVSAINFDSVSGRVSSTRSTVRPAQTIRAASLATTTFSAEPGRDDVSKKFYVWFNSKVSGIHAAVTHLKTILFLDRTDVSNTLEKMPNGKPAYASEFNISNKVQRPLDVKSNVFCSTGQFLPDGTFLSIGGATDAVLGIGDSELNGLLSIRSFTPCVDQTCEFSIVGRMFVKRWYATSIITASGKVMIVGGAATNGNIAINNANVNNPTYEFWPRGPEDQGEVYLPFLDDTLPYNLYPIVHQMPSGLIFIFAGLNSILLNITTNQVVATLPPMSWPTGVFRLYPVAGSTALLPLSSANNYRAEVLICGGNSGTANSGNKDKKTGALLGGKVAATNTCGRIAPEDASPVWEYDFMPTARVMPDLLHLVDGSVLIINGAGTGFEGLKQEYATTPVLKPVIYDYNKPKLNAKGQYGNRFFTVNQGSMIPRMYHSSALILPDASVMISGSNPNAAFTKTGSYPTEFRVEMFTPPYLWSTTIPRPVLVQVPSAASVGSTFVVTFTGAPPSSTPSFQACVLHPGFSTHNNRHGMRYVFVDIVSLTPVEGTMNTYKATILAPPNLNVAPPGYYWFHIIDRGVPNKEGAAINISP